MGWHTFSLRIFLIVCMLWKFAIISIITIKNMHAHRYKCSNSDSTITTKSVMQTTNLTKKTKDCFAIWMNHITRWLIICSFKFDKFVVRKTAGLVYAQTTNLTKKTKDCFAIWMNLITRWLIICSFKFDKFVVRKQQAGCMHKQRI